MEVARERFPPGTRRVFALNAKIAEITRKNAEVHFALVMRLAEVKDLHEALELQNRHMKQQMDFFAKQLEEMRDLAAQLVQEANTPRSDSAGARRAPRTICLQVERTLPTPRPQVSRLEADPAAAIRSSSRNRG